MDSFKRLAVYSLLLSFIRISYTLSILTPTRPIRDGTNETLVSAGGTFEAGFFSFASSKNHYVGIWYKNISTRTVVWIANREEPLPDSSGVFQVSSDGLSIINSRGDRIWSSNLSKTTEKPVVQLLESGNLVVKDRQNLDSILWQSFDHPGDTFLPGMKLGSNFKTGQSLALTSWKNLEDPSPGEFSMGIDTHGLPQLVVTNGGRIIYRAGSWNGLSFTGTPMLRNYSFMKFVFVLNDEEVLYENEILDSSILMRSRLTPEGYPVRLTWSNQTKNWETGFSSAMDKCENYGLCGANTNCNASSTKVCECLTGFTDKSQDSDGSFGGCARTTQQVCNKGDRFQKHEGMKLPDTSSSWYDKTISLQECEKLCLSNCSCTAYANLNISGGGSGCLHWFDHMMDMRELPEGGQDFYLRLLADHTNNSQPFNKKKLSGIVIGSATFILGTIVFGLIICIQKKKLKHSGIAKLIYWKDKKEKEDIDLPIFDFSAISNATNNFSESNKLGQGGFGPVYKGLLVDGQEIAVKRLSKTSKQGIDEFKNEVLLISKLQHRNLVKLLGCSIQQTEKLLIYEFMPNRSLDYFIFDSTRRTQLDWAKRLEIIGGIARGLLYLHQDSRLRIIHRDLKTSNILLDSNMYPKISDFGLAKIFGGDQAEEEANTNRVMGTYGYMPPEYAVHGSFSIKSDVFSFGVIVLEIISGRKNRGFSDPDHHLNLLGHAWRLWNEEKAMELMDKSLDDSATPFEILRCFHVGLLCVQQKPEDRPNMATVVLMLNGEKLLPEPRQPGFYTGSDNPTQVDSSSINSGGRSLNEVSISELEAR